MDSNIDLTVSLVAKLLDDMLYEVEKLTCYKNYSTFASSGDNSLQKSYFQKQHSIENIESTSSPDSGCESFIGDDLATLHPPANPICSSVDVPSSSNFSPLLINTKKSNPEFFSQVSPMLPLLPPPNPLNQIQLTPKDPSQSRNKKIPPLIVEAITPPATPPILTCDSIVTAKRPKRDQIVDDLISKIIKTQTSNHKVTEKAARASGKNSISASGSTMYSQASNPANTYTAPTSIPRQQIFDQAGSTNSQFCFGSSYANNPRYSLMARTPLPSNPSAMYHSNYYYVQPGHPNTYPVQWIPVPRGPSVPMPGLIPCYPESTPTSTTKRKRMKHQPVQTPVQNPSMVNMMPMQSAQFQKNGYYYYPQHHFPNFPMQPQMSQNFSPSYYNSNQAQLAHPSGLTLLDEPVKNNLQASPTMPGLLPIMPSVSSSTNSAIKTSEKDSVKSTDWYAAIACLANKANNSPDLIRHIAGKPKSNSKKKPVSKKEEQSNIVPCINFPQKSSDDNSITDSEMESSTTSSDLELHEKTPLASEPPVKKSFKKSLLNRYCNAVVTIT